MTAGMTKLGKNTFYVLAGLMLVDLIELIIGVTSILFLDISRGMEAVVATTSIFASAVYLFVIGMHFFYWNAYRKNEPEKLKMIITALLVLMIIATLITLLVIIIVKGSGLVVDNPGILGDGSSESVLMASLLRSVIYMIILSEIRHPYSEKMKKAWKIVGVLSLLSFLGGLWGIIVEEFSALNAAAILRILITAVAETLISYWITNRDKFFSV